MKRILSLLLMATFMLLLLTPSRSFAYTGGLINGKSMCLSNGIGLEGTQTALSTDNNLATYTSVPMFSSVVSAVDTLYYQFDCPMDLTSYQIKADSTGVTLYIMFQDGSHATLSNAVINGTQTTVNYKNVTAVGMQSSNAAKVYEFDVFGDTNKTAPSVPTEFKATTNSSSLILNWKPSSESDFKQYNVYQDGSLVATVTDSTYTIVGLTPGTEHTFQVSAVDCALNESEKAELTTSIPVTPQPSSGQAILVVTMTTGLEKEFDLSMDEVNAFIDWYENKQAGTGTASYAINKHDNNKGPFTSRKDYVIFDKILTFEVSEYTTE